MDDPLVAVRKHCLDCSGGLIKYRKWCPCTDCPLWPYRFGMRPKTAKRRYGSEIMDPKRMPPASVCLDNLKK